MVEVVPLTCGVDALADFMDTAGTGEVERSSTGPRAWSWSSWHVKSVPKSPLGQVGRPASAGECTARPSTHGVGMESETKAREAPSTQYMGARVDRSLFWSHSGGQRGDARTPPV